MSDRSSTLLPHLKRLVRGFVRRDSKIPIGAVRWGDLRCQEPICANFGYGRGKPIDRRFIEDFIASCSDDVTGRVLEIKDSNYTRRFGGSRVGQSDVLDINSENKAATIVADLNDAAALESDVYDCVIFTQTLQYLFAPINAVRHLHRSLKPGGVLLLTVPGITPLRECGADWYWNFTTTAVERLLGELFPSSATSVRSYGNLICSTAFLYGLSSQELYESEIAFFDPAYQLIIAARAVKANR